MFHRLNVKKNILFLLLCCLACSQPKAQDPVAWVGDQAITVAEFQQALYRELASSPELAQEGSDSFQETKKRVLENLVELTLLLRGAQDAGFNLSEEEFEKEILKFKNRYTENNFQLALQGAGISDEEWFRWKRQVILVQKFLDQKSQELNEITPDMIEAYYNSHLKEFEQPESVHIRQIVTDSQEKAEAILRRLRRGENFAKLAQDLSLSPDRKQGGDLGNITRGSFPREFELCFQMKPGEISPIIPSAYGFHLFKVLEKIPEQTLSLKQVEGRIALQLKVEYVEKARQDLLKDLKQKYPLKFEEKTLARLKAPSID